MFKLRAFTSTGRYLSIFRITDNVFQSNHLPIFCIKTQTSRLAILAYNNNNLPVICNTLSENKFFHTDVKLLKKNKKEDEKAVMEFPDFEYIDEKNKRNYFKLINEYETVYTNRAGHVDFIKTALKKMKEFGVHQDLEAYKKLVDVLPKGVFIISNRLLADSMYYSKQQFVVMTLLEQMESNGVLPDVEMGKILQSIFGKIALPCKKYYKMLYWSRKFKNRSPWLLPKNISNDALDLGKLAIERITAVDLQTEITVFQTTDVPESLDKTWIVSGQSPKQKELLTNHSPQAPVVVEGGDRVWLRDKTVNYFVLKADTEPFPCKLPKDKGDISQLSSPFFNPDLSSFEQEEEERSVHEQDDGLIYAVCATGTSSKDSLLSWVRLLQKNGNPILENVPVLFRFREGEKSPVPFSEALIEQKNAEA